MTQAEKMLREIVPKDHIWEEMNHLDNMPIDMIIKVMDSYGQSQSIAFGVFCGFGSKAQLERLYSQFIEHQSKQV